MSNLLWKALRLSPVLLGATLLMAGRSQAAETPVAELASKSDTIAQVTSVSQLSDVQPTDWAFQALQSLVERYGCIAGYPDSTFRGNRALTRYEFAAGLNACLDRVNELIATATADLVTKEDLATLQRLQEEFSAELATLRGRVDSLEAQTAELEANQFSTTTKLSGEAIFAVNGVFGGDNSNRAVISGRPQGSAGNFRDNETFSDRVRLSLNTSFSGRDLLRTRLQMRNTVPFGTNVTGTNMTRLGFDGDENNQVIIDQLFYRIPLGDRAIFQVDAANTELNERGFATFSPFEATGRGAISRYGRFSPIYRQGAGQIASGQNGLGAGAGASLILNPQGPIGLNLAYLAPTSNQPGRGFGIANGSYAAVGQITIQPTKAFNVGLTYAHTYDNQERRLGSNLTGPISLFDATGSQLANAPFGNVPTTGNHYGLEASFRLSPKIILFGWGGYTNAIAERSPRFSTSANGATLTGPTGSKADIWYYAGGLGFPDLGKEGSLAGVLFGQAPKLTANDSVRETDLANGIVNRRRRDTGTSYHIEGFYRYPISDNIEITPGVLVILNPEHNNSNGTEYVGTLRTTFRF